MRHRNSANGTQPPRCKQPELDDDGPHQDEDGAWHDLDEPSRGYGPLDLESGEPLEAFEKDDCFDADMEADWEADERRRDEDL